MRDRFTGLGLSVISVICLSGSLCHYATIGYYAKVVQKILLLVSELHVPVLAVST